MMPCVKISNAKKDEEVDGKLLLWSPRREETVMYQIWLPSAVCTAAAACMYESKRELASYYTILHNQVEAGKHAVQKHSLGKKSRLHVDGL